MSGASPAMPEHAEFTLLIVPGLNDSGPTHWQTLWQQTYPRHVRLTQQNWADHDPDDWVANLDFAIQHADAPVVIVAHSLGTITVARWVDEHWSALMENPNAGPKLVAALLVAPCDIEQANAGPELRRFSPLPAKPLPFRSLVVASTDDQYCSFERARRMAEFWGSSFVSVGASGHINAKSQLGDWPFGQVLLADLFRSSQPPRQLALKQDNARITHINAQYILGARLRQESLGSAPGLQ